jgi:diacylglycerol kinase family enzyme
MRTVVIVNPVSGAGRTGARWPGWRDLFSRVLGPFDEVVTRGLGDGTRATREALQSGAARIVCVGGDGSNHDIVRGFFDPDSHRPVRPDALFGFVPCGTGSDLGRSFEAGAVPMEAWLTRLIASPGRAIDVIGCSYTTDAGSAWQPCVNAASVGQGGDLVQRVGRWKRFGGGGLPFVLAGIEGAVFVKAWQVALDWDDAGPAERVHVRNLAILNGRFQGGGMHVAPGAALDDGLLDVVAIGDVGAVKSVRIGLSSYKAGMQAFSEVWQRSARRMTVTPTAGQVPMGIELDGELVGRAPAVFEVMAGALRVAV